MHAQVSARLTAPVVTTYVNTEQIAFERAKSGVWGFRTDKSETVNGYDCKVSMDSKDIVGAANMMRNVSRV